MRMLRGCSPFDNRQSGPALYVPQQACCRRCVTEHYTGHLATHSRLLQTRPSVARGANLRQKARVVVSTATPAPKESKSEHQGQPSESPRSHQSEARSLPRRSWQHRLFRALPILVSKELWWRVAGTAGLLTLLRLGLFISLPGLVPGLDMRKEALQAGAQEIFGMESPVPLNIFLLGIGPTINATLVLTFWQCLPFAPGYKHLKELRQQGQEGASIFKLYIQQLALAFAVVMGAYEAVKLRHLKIATMKVVAAAGIAQVHSGTSALVWKAKSGFLKFFSTTDTAITLVAGAVLVRWLCDHMEPWGLGDGLSLIICASMTTRYVTTLPSILQLVSIRAPPVWQLAAAALAVSCVLFIGLYLSQLERRYPIIRYKQHTFAPPSGMAATRDKLLRELEKGAPGAQAEVAPQTDYLPLRVAPAGMTPLLMAGFYLGILPKLLTASTSSAGWAWPAAFDAWLRLPRVQPWALALTVFTTGLVSLQSNSKELADWLTQSDIGIRGQVPGAPTARFLDRQQSLMRGLGAAALAGMTLMTHALDQLCEVYLGSPLGCTSLLLIASFLASVQRQVIALLQLPKIRLALDQEKYLVERAAAYRPQTPYLQ